GYNQSTLWGLTQEEMAELYSNVDIYVNAAWYEGFGLPSLEAMASGVPLIQVNNKGLDGIAIDKKNCLVVKPDDPSDMASKIEQLINNNKLAEELVINGLETVESYTLVTQYDQFVKAFEKILLCKFNEGIVDKAKQDYLTGGFEEQLKIATKLMHPKISLIIPATKEMTNLEKTITSLKSQIYTNWEAIIVYTGLTANEQKQIRHYSLVDGRVKTVESKSNDYGDLLNTGILSSNGEWIILMPAGTYYTSDRLVNIINAWEQNPDKKLFYTDYYVDKGDGSVPELPDKKWIKNIPTKEFQLIGLFNYNYIYTQSLFIHRSIFSEVGYYHQGYNIATVYHHLLRVLQKYDTTFMQVGGCAGDKVISPETVPDNMNSINDFKRAAIDIIKDFSFEELFPQTDLSDSRNYIDLSRVLLTVIKSPNSLANLLSISDELDSKLESWLESIEEAGIKNRIKEIKNNYGTQLLLKENKYSNKYKEDDLSFISSNKTKKNQENRKPNSQEQDLVSIIIPSYNSAEYLDNCIDSIIKNSKTDFELILVDNASDEETKKVIAEYSNKYKNIKPIYNDKNVGFPGAVNQGFRQANGNYIVIANNDIIVTDGWLERMIQVANADNKIGMVGPVSNIVSGVQLDKDADYKTIEGMHIYAEDNAKVNSGKFFEFPRVAFLCTLIKKEVINKIGGLDERFSPGNFEDDDFCLRAQLAGYKTVIATDVFIHHYGSVSFKAGGDKEYANRLEINKNKFVEKWGADPDEIWLHGKDIKERNIIYPINNDLFAQSLERAMIYIDEAESVLAFENLELAIDNYIDSLRGGYENVKLSDLLILAANLALSTNDLEKSKEYFESALNEDPNSSEACQGLGEIFIAVGDNQAAKSMLEWAVKNDENNSEAIKRLSEVNTFLDIPVNHNSLLIED
ncbi:MAG: glycosyltransferase, partial [Melioribacteraceae bacterium]|nr:glycosyltransferase [Melioribacteraceae bacterium]